MTRPPPTWNEGSEVPSVTSAASPATCIASSTAIMVAVAAAAIVRIARDPPPAATPIT